MASIGRASALIAAGTLISRITGLLRSIMLAAVFGTIGIAGDAFGLANQLPNNIFTILQAGVLTAVLVPQIVKAAADRDGGSAFISKLFTLGTVVLVIVTGIAMLFAPMLITLYTDDITPAQHALATAFAYWCLPQVFFYGLYALIGETFNARNVYGPFTWTPILNNLVSIAGFGVIIVLWGSGLGGAADWTPERIAVLGAIATGGIAVQALGLLFFWRRVGIRIRPDFRWRGMGLRNIARLAGWTFLMVLVGQLAGIVQSRVLIQATGEGAATFASQNVWLLFMLPYSLIVVSLGTPYFTRIAEHAAAGRHHEVRQDVSASIRTIGVLIVPALAALVAAAVPASRIFANSASEAEQLALVLIAYLVSLVPLSVLFVVQRTFYAYDDTRRPFVFTLVQGILVVITALLVGHGITADLLPLAYVGMAIALGQSIAVTVQTLLAIGMLQRRIGTLGVGGWLVSYLRFTVAAVPAGFAGWGVYLLVGGAESWMTSDRILGAVGSGVIGVVVVIVYAAALFALRAPELRTATSLVRRIVRR